MIAPLSKHIGNIAMDQFHMFYMNVLKAVNDRKHMILPFFSRFMSLAIKNYNRTETYFNK